MREIKFRAWNPETKLLGGGMNLEDLIYYNLRPSAPNLKGWTWQQYTGLKDKNGNTSVEVYEGDIIDVDGKVKGNIYEMDAGETDLVIQGFGTKTWCKTYNEAISRGCYDSE